MKGNYLIAAAVATVLGTGAAHALSPAATAAVPANNIFYSGGGSAEVNAVIFAAAAQMQAGTIDYYTDAAGFAPSSSYVILSGNAAKTIGSITAGNPILFYYKFNGGSYPNGGQPQTAIGGAVTLAYPTQASLGTSVTAGGGPFPIPTFQYVANTGASAVPDFGITDEEVGLFQFADNLGGKTALTAAQLGAITQTPIYDALFGIAVTNKLYNGSGTPATSKTNFSKAEMAEILAGNYQNWNQLFADDGKTPLAAGPIVLLDRSSGSGSKAAGNQYFLGYPGSKTLSGAIDPGSVTNGYQPTATAVASTSFAGYQDISEGSSGQIVKDLQQFNKAGLRAIAILGLEFPPGGNELVAGVNDYSFTKINGVGVDTGYDSTTVVSPITGHLHDNINDVHGTGGSTSSGTSYTNAVNGSYDFFYQASFNVRKPTSFTNPNSAAWEADMLAQLTSNTIPAAATGLLFQPGAKAVPGILLDPITAGVTAGAVAGSRSGNSTATLLNVADASVVPGALPLGFDPL